MSVLECSHKLGYISDVNNITSQKVNKLIYSKKVYLNDFSERHFVMSLNDLSMTKILFIDQIDNSDLVRFAGISIRNFAITTKFI